MDIQGIAAALLKATADSDAKDLIVEHGDDAIASMSIPLLENIPVLKTLVGIVSAGVAIKEQFFLQKVAIFLHSLDSVGPNEKSEFQLRMEKDFAFRQKVGSTLVLLLDRLDDHQKAGMIAKCHSALVNGKIDYDTFRRLGAAIDIGFIDDLKWFLVPEPNPDLQRMFRQQFGHYVPDRFSNLLPAGLVEIVEGEFSVKHRISSLGNLFKTIMTPNPS